MQMLGGRGGGSGANVGGTDPGVRAATAARGRTAQAAAGPAGGSDAEFDDDIPF